MLKPCIDPKCTVHYIYFIPLRTSYVLYVCAKTITSKSSSIRNTIAGLTEFAQTIYDIFV